MQTRNMGVWVLSLHIPHEITQNWFFDKEDKALHIKNLVDKLLPLFPKYPYETLSFSSEEIQKAYTEHGKKIDEIYSSISIPDFFTLEEMKSICEDIVDEGVLTVHELVLGVY
jgi:hypothetical protein